MPAHKGWDQEVNKAVVVFLIGLMVICFYDMGLYYCNYVVAPFSCMGVMRIGNCLIAITMFLWLRLQKQILDREAIRSLDKMVGGYMLVYAAGWFLLTVAVPMDQLCTIKWIFLAGDVVLVISFLASSVAHIIYASDCLLDPPRILYDCNSCVGMTIYTPSFLLSCRIGTKTRTHPRVFVCVKFCTLKTDGFLIYTSRNMRHFVIY